ncbi:MAG: helix-turn-helix transcriptional regulator [Clostridia bacterium]|nr:helix-turn-helix transcriptional regulator [Clostridia bacterium]
MRQTREKGKGRGSYFRSGVFKRLFLSYTLIIVLVFGIFIGWSVVSYCREAADLATREWEQKAESWGTWMDQQLIQAQMLCAAVNASESARSALQTVYVEKKTMSSLQLYNMLGDLTRILGAVRSTSLYNVMLAFQGENKVYLPGNVYSVKGNCQALQTTPYLGVTTAAQLMEVSGNQMMLNKEYLIYGEAYTGFGSQSSIKGEVLVLMEQDQIRMALRERTAEGTSVQILRRGQTAYLSGEATGRVFRTRSLVDNTLEYEVTVPEKLISRLLPASAWIPLFIMALASIFFVLVTYWLSRRYYRPIDEIHQLVEKPAQPSAGEEGNEFDAIIHGISSLIGERNGYRERMVTITPYAKQGMLQAAIRGVGRTEMLVEEQFTELKRDYYTVGLVNLAITREIPAAERRYQDLQELTLSVCRDAGGEEIQVVAVPENLQNTFVIAAGDEKGGFEDFFYGLYNALEEHIGDENTVITLGVGHRENDLERLNAACREAQTSLAQMLTGGRGAVYFPEDRVENAPGYYFPKDAQKQMVRMLKERDLAGLNGLLDDIYQRNMVEADLPAVEARQLADELYWTIRKALRNAYDLSTIHIRMEPIRGAATMEEIFAYYRQVFAASLQEAPLQEGEENEQSLEEEICRYLEEHLYDPNLSLNGVADRFGVSAKMVGLICRKRYGQTFLNYVRDRQIHRAVEMLKETDLSLEEISGQCGFTNILTFRRNFKAVMGVNPSEYRG